MSRVVIVKKAEGVTCCYCCGAEWPEGANRCVVCSAYFPLYVRCRGCNRELLVCTDRVRWCPFCHTDLLHVMWAIKSMELNGEVPTFFTTRARGNVLHTFSEGDD